MFGLIETEWVHTVGVMMLVAAFIIFALCVAAALFNHNDSLKAAPELGNRRRDGLAIVRLSGFTAVEMVCEHCETTQPLHKGMCVGCWLKLMQHIVFCEDCGTAWQPAPDDSKDICPRCRVLKLGIVPPADMSETEKMRKRTAGQVPYEQVPYEQALKNFHENCTGKGLDYSSSGLIAFTAKERAAMQKEKDDVSEFMHAAGRRAAKQTSKRVNEIMRTYPNGASPYCQNCFIECKGEFCSDTCKDIYQAAIPVDENSVEVI